LHPLADVFDEELLVCRETLCIKPMDLGGVGGT
jgi:hypothetical protein